MQPFATVTLLLRALSSKRSQAGSAARVQHGPSINKVPKLVPVERDHRPGEKFSISIRSLPA
jgi:hypothetical protein